MNSFARFAMILLLVPSSSDVAVLVLHVASSAFKAAAASLRENLLRQIFKRLTKTKKRRITSWSRDPLKQRHRNTTLNSKIFQ